MPRPEGFGQSKTSLGRLLATPKKSIGPAILNFRYPDDHIRKGRSSRVNLIFHGFSHQFNRIAGRDVLYQGPIPILDGGFERKTIKTNRW